MVHVRAPAKTGGPRLPPLRLLLGLDVEDRVVRDHLRAELDLRALRARRGVDRGRIRVSIKAALQDEERQAYRAYQQQANATSVGVSLADKLRKLNLPRSGE